MESDDRWFLLLGMALLLLFLLLLAGCAIDDPTRRQVQADGEKAMHERHSERVRSINR